MEEILTMLEGNRKWPHAASSFTMRFDRFTLDMLERIAYEEDTTRPETVRAAVKYLFIEKYGKEELEQVRRRHWTSFFENQDTQDS